MRHAGGHKACQARAYRHRHRLRGLYLVRGRPHPAGRLYEYAGENRSLLAKVDDRETVYGKGYVGWVNKRRVLVGNRALMQDYGIKIPSLEYEQHHTVNQRRVIYLAVSGKLFAMFQVAYQRDPDTAAVLETLHHNGLSLVVECDDFNCDVKLLETAYSLPAGSVKVLSSAEHQAMAPAVAWLPESRAICSIWAASPALSAGWRPPPAQPRASISRPSC